MRSILKVVGSKFWSDSVIITGNREGLEKLKTAIECSLQNDETTFVAEVTETDGNDYIIYCTMLDGDLLDEQWMEKSPTHYESDDLTNEERDFLSKFINDGDLKYV